MPSSKHADTFARPSQLALSPAFTPRRLPPRKPGFTLADLKGETERPAVPKKSGRSSALFMPGFTHNHKVQSLAGWYGTDPTNEEIRDLVLYFFGPHISTHGFEGNEFIFSSSHWGHFGAAYGPLLYFAMRAQDTAITTTMTRVWKQALAAARLLSYVNSRGEWRIVTPCARCHLAKQEHSDQRIETNLTMQWLATGELAPKIPLWLGRALAINPHRALEVSPSILGLYALQQIQRTYEQGIYWAGKWPRVLQEIRAESQRSQRQDLDELRDLPPLKHPLIVYRTPHSHFAEILITKGLRNPAQWAYADHKAESESYGYPAKDMLDAGEAIRGAVEQKKDVVRYEFPLAGLMLE
jgi:hypothetical protein